MNIPYCSLLVLLLVARYAHTYTLVAVPSGYEQVGENCNCGNRIQEWASGYETAELCATACDANTACVSFGSWHTTDAAGYCSLFDAACTDTDGWEADTTCPTPTATTHPNVGYNKIVCVDEDCDDGNVCNGVEYCDDSGECVSPDDFGDCPLFFVCDPSFGCVRDCDTFAIDGYLQDCSAEFDTIKTEGVSLIEAIEDANTDISGLQTEVTAVQGDVVTLQSDLSDLSSSVDGISSNVESIMTALEALSDRLSTVEAFIEAFGPNNAGGESTAGNQFNSPSEQASAAGDASAFMRNDDALEHTVMNAQWIQMAAIVVVLLLVVNVVLLLRNCCGAQAKGKGKYQGVVQQCSSDDERVQFRA